MEAAPITSLPIAIAIGVTLFVATIFALYWFPVLIRGGRNSNMPNGKSNEIEACECEDSSKPSG